MGASSSSTHPAGHPLREEVDAPLQDALVPPSRLRARAIAGRQKYLLSLDRSLKAFLRASNLPGLEYRLRLAGYHTFHDLLSADQPTLEAQGFTGIMAKRLLRAVADYLRKQLCRSEGERLPFRLVRRGQRIQTEPSESLRENPNYQKRNVKRQKSSGEDTARNMAASSHQIAPAPMPSRVRLMAESDLQLQHLIYPAPQPPEVTSGEGGGSVEPAVEGTGAAVGVETVGSLPPADDRGQKILGVIVRDDDALLVVEDTTSSDGEDPPLSELDDAQLREEALLSLNQLRHSPFTVPGSDLASGAEETDCPDLPPPGLQIHRCFSVPADLKLSTAETASSEEFVFNNIRAFSCGTLSPLPTPATTCPCYQSSIL